jgi:hypothetical protein
MEALLAGPSQAEAAWKPAITSDIPDGTRLLDLSVDNGTATVTLSPEWQLTVSNFRGGTATTEVVYTLTQFPSITAVRIQTENKPAQGAIGRADLQTVGLVPAIFVDRPAFGAAVDNPARISGLANVFEATFRAQLLDAKGNVLVDEQVMASCGTGCWGKFAKSLVYEVAKAQYGSLRVYDLSAKDGTPENVLVYRVWLTPAT